MATITPTNEHVGPGTEITTWAGITENDVCTPISIPASAEVSCQITGTFGSGNIPIEGSINGASYETMDDIENDPITPDGVKQEHYTLRDNVRYVQPGVPTGTSVTLSVWVMAKQVV